MKRFALLILALVMTTIMTAGEVTPQQASEQARRFIQQQEAAGSRIRKAPSVSPQLTMTSRVSGLYVFNINQGDGFVIVANDDRAIPILGFSDSGSIDVENIPENMRAWLQGYADEIAWLNKYNVMATINAPHRQHRVGHHSTTNIAPLITTTWNQYEPYNNQCPEYAPDERAATGCVATAMAQVMNYYQWPTYITKEIPAYTTRSYRINLPELPATIFSWANMRDNYTGNESNSQKSAVAQLMRYCGQAVEMDYGPTSGTSTNIVAEAFKTYFGYNKTTQFISRSYYSSANWTDLIYHELAHKRPVLYGGESSGGAHEFVCDGYKYEYDIDFFHINWGWSGLSDDYYVLSALDPETQGIGGSTSADGYHYGQDAIIGIQPSTGIGTVADIAPNSVNLKLNSITASRTTITLGEEVEIILNITNNSNDDYEGDIYVWSKNVYQNQEYYIPLSGNNVVINSHETTDIVIPVTPPETGTCDLILFLPGDDGYYYSYEDEGYITINILSPVTLISNATRPTGKDWWFTPDGHRFFEKPTKKGFYIINGNKTIIK